MGLNSPLLSWIYALGELLLEVETCMDVEITHGLPCGTRRLSFRCVQKIVFIFTVLQ